MSDAELVFGSLPLLSPGFADADYTIEALGDGADFGTPEAVIASVASMLMDGNKARINGFGNREVTIPIQIRGANLDIVAAGEAAVMAEVNRGRNTLTWTPPGMATPSVYDVVYSTLPSKWLDLDETRATRQFVLNLECISFPRRDTLTTTIALPSSGSATVTSINDCTSLAGWATNAVGTVVSGAIEVNAVSGGFLHGQASAMLTQSFTLNLGEYVVWEIKDPGGKTPNFTLNGASAVAVASESLVGGAIRWFVRPIGTSYPYSITSAGVNGQIGAGNKRIINDVSKFNKLPVIGAGYQRSLIASVGGTARTAADIVVDMASGSAGPDCLLYTALADTFPPSMRIWKSAGETATPDATRISGARNTFATPVAFTIPAGMLKPAPYLMVPYMKGTAVSTTISWVATTVGTYADTTTDLSGSMTATMPTTYAFYQLGVVSLPTIKVDPSSTSSTKITLTSSVTAVTLDEVLFYNMNDGELTWISGIAGSPTKVEVRSATVDRDRPEWLVGTAGTDADNADVASRAISPGVHEFLPGDMFVHLVTPTSTTQTVSVEHYERFMHNVTPQAS